jgi:hypothetical protein
MVVRFHFSGARKVCIADAVFSTRGRPFCARARDARCALDRNSAKGNADGADRADSRGLKADRQNDSFEFFCRRSAGRRLFRHDFESENHFAVKSFFPFIF